MGIPYIGDYGVKGLCVMETYSRNDSSPLIARVYPPEKALSEAIAENLPSQRAYAEDTNKLCRLCHLASDPASP